MFFAERPSMADDYDPSTSQETYLVSIYRAGCVCIFPAILVMLTVTSSIAGEPGGQGEEVLPESIRKANEISTNLPEATMSASEIASPFSVGRQR
jgi:hypothetical protein